MNNTNTGTKKALTNVTDISDAKQNVSEKTNSSVQSLKETAQNLKETAQTKFEQVGTKVEDYKGKVSENLSGAAVKVHEKSDSAQEYLEAKAEKLNDYTHQAIGKVNQYGHKAGDALDVSSEYVKKFDFAETAQSVKSGIKDRPGTSIALVGVAGLLIGFLIGRSR